MDGFMNMAKQAYGQYQQSQGQGQQGSGGGGGGSNPMDMLSSFLNGDQAASHAANETGDDPGLFQNAVSHMSQNFDDGEPIDEQGTQQAHEQAYGQGNAGQLGAKSMGAAAAMQALKKFTQGGGSTSGGGNTQSALIGQAMSEAAKLFNQSGGAASGGKQDAVNGAAQMMMKLLVQSKMSGMFGTGGGGGGGGELMSLASKFM